MNKDSHSLVSRFRSIYASARVSFLSDAPIVVAVSGGLDSVTLLHLLRFGLSQSHPLHAAHFDHCTRDDSGADARWVSGLCRAWNVPLTLGRAEEVLTSEESARDARHIFLDSVRIRMGSKVVVMAHHSDDQAETVFFRMVRGTGLRGLCGIAEYREPGIWRPLLSFWRDEIARYAQEVRLTWREDATNHEHQFTRSIIRNDLFPAIESTISPAVKRSLVRISDLARADEEAWASLLKEVLETLKLKEGSGVITLDFQEISRFHRAIRSRVLRELAGRLSYQLDATGTRLASDFIDSASSGQKIDLTGGLQLRRDLDQLVFLTKSVGVHDRPLLISNLQPGSGTALLGGRELLVKWSPEERCDSMLERFALTAPCFPLMIRARQPGDRIRMSAGTRKLKKLFLEARIPQPERHQIPLLVDGVGRIIWVPGIAKAAPFGDEERVGNILHIGISDAKAI